MHLRFLYDRARQWVFARAYLHKSDKCVTVCKLVVGYNGRVCLAVSMNVRQECNKIVLSEGRLAALLIRRVPPMNLF